MSFKLLIKQAFLNIASKLRLYLSLIIFMIVGFSIIAGVGTYFNSFTTHMTSVINDGIVTNFAIPKFKFASYDEKTIDNNQQSNMPQDVLYQLSEKGETSFYQFLSDVSGLKIPDLKEDKLASKLGQVYGDITLINGSDMNDNNHFDDDVSKLTELSKYYGHNVMFMFIDNVIFENSSHIKTTLFDSFTATDKDNPGITFKLRSIPENSENNDKLKNPFSVNGLNSIHKYNDEKLQKDSGIPFYVSANYLRYTKSKVGDDLTVSSNNKFFKGYIAGTASDKMNLFHPTDTANLYVDLNTLGLMTNDSYSPSEKMNGYYPIDDNSNAYKNEKEYKLAFDKVNELIGIGNDKDDSKFFNFTNNNATKVELLSLLDNNNSIFAFYHQPIDLYNAFALVIMVAVGILMIVIIYFIIDESIRSEKKTLWFLKSLGEHNFKLSLVNSFSAFVPLLIALGLAVPGTMLMMEFLTQAVTTDYAFSIHFYQLTWLTAIMFVCFLIGTMIIFMLLNVLVLVTGALSIQSNDSMSKFQIFLAKVTEPLLRETPGKFRVGFAFVRQNLIKNLVSFFVFTILFSVTLFGVQFNKSIDTQKTSYQNWMGDYHAISTLSPKRMVTWDSTNETTYKTIDNNEYQQLIDVDKSDKYNSTNAMSKEFNYDVISFLNYVLLDGQDVNKENGDGITIDSSNHTFVSLPQTQEGWDNLFATLQSEFSVYYTIEQATNAIKNLDGNLLENLQTTRGNDYQYTKATSVQWALRELQDISLWKLYGWDDDGNNNPTGGYIYSASKLINQLPDNIKSKLPDQLNKVISHTPANMQPILRTIMQLFTVQKQMFGVENPGINISLSNIVKPAKLENKAKPISATGLSANYDGESFLAYGMDKNEQPFTKKINGLDSKLDTNIDQNIYRGVKYQVINAKFSQYAKNKFRWKLGDIIPVDLSQSGVKSEYPLALKIDGWVNDDSTILEAFFDKQPLYEFLNNSFNGPGNNVVKVNNLDNTMYTESEIPYFIQNITVPHMIGDGKYIDDYIYKLDTFMSDHKTTAIITKVFGQMVDSYSKLMTRFIILLIVLAFAISSIIITLIMFENKKTILLFKAMGYKKSEVIWYIVTGYLIAAILALGLSFGLTVLFTHILAPVAAVKIQLILQWHGFWLYFAIGFFETIAFMILMVMSIVTYTRVLKPKDAFATL